MFRFRLEKVRRLRSRLVDERARELRATIERLVAVDVRVAALDAEIRRYGDLAVATDAERLDVERLQQRCAWLARLRAERDRVLETRREAAVAVGQARERLVIAHRDREVLDRLRERQEEAWREREERNERKRLDEIAAVRAVRKQRAELA
jgi:flagellar FliJ protein